MYQKLREKFKEIIKDHSLENSKIKITSKVLTKQEAIGNPEHDDYPLLKGKENLMESEFCGSKGAAYSDMCGNFEGTLEDVTNLKLNNNYERAIFISSINAVLKYLKLISKTEHCKDSGPVECANHLKNYIEDNYKNSNILLIGFQPRFVEILTKNFLTNTVDLNPENIGKIINEKEVYPEESTDSFNRKK